MSRVLGALACLFAATALAGQVAITSPGDGAAIQDPDGRIPVALNLSLIPGERVRLLLNGVVTPVEGQGDRLVLVNVDRGEHRLEAEVVDEKGSVVAVSPPVTIHVIRVTALRRGQGNVPGPQLGEPTPIPPVNPATTVGAPNPNNPPDTIGRPNPTNPPGAIGAPNPSNPSGTIGTPSANAPVTGPGAAGTPSANAPVTGPGAPGAPGPNNPAATVGRPAATAPAR